MKFPLPLAPLSRQFAVGLWLAVAAVAAALIATIWPAPYVFYVSQLEPIGVEQQGDQFVKLDRWEDGYKKLHVFQRKRTAVALLSAALAASIVLTLAAAIFARDNSWQAWLVALIAAALAMAAADRALPPFVDPVYGTGFQLDLPRWITVPLVLAVAAFAIAPLFLLRWLVGRWQNRLREAANA